MHNISINQQFNVTSRQKYEISTISGFCEKISTTEILEKLKAANGNYTGLFYLFVSTGGVKQKLQKRRHLPSGQQVLDKYTYLSTSSDSDDTESEENNDEPMETDHDTTIFQSKIPVEDNPSLSASRKARMHAMKQMHESILPRVLYPHGWKRVYDKDMKTVYRALYFNVIERAPNESDISHIQRVSKVRDMICEEANKLKIEHGVNFNVNCLLSKPILYDKQTLEGMSMREDSTQIQHIDEYFK